MNSSQSTGSSSERVPLKSKRTARENGLELMAVPESLSTDGSTLLVAWADGHRGIFHAAWLRDNCACPDCRHESGQRLLDSAAIPDGIAVTAARTEGETILAR